MSSSRTSPSYRGLQPASRSASQKARAASRKRDTKVELLLRRELHRRGFRYTVDDRSLPGRPDLCFKRARTAVFVDGDFWHGRNLSEGLRRLAAGHNSGYWVAKISGNVERDRKNDSLLRDLGWAVVRIWESEVLSSPQAAADRVAKAVEDRAVL